MPAIFILDDDNISNELNKILFRLSGITGVEIRTSGREAIEYLQQCKENSAFPDILFVDLHLSGMNGFEFIRDYERNFMRYNPGHRIIILTNSILEEDRKKAMEFDSVLDFFSKPLNKNKIREILARLNVEF